MTPTLWAILLVFEAIGLVGQWIVGSGKWWGWLIVLGHSIPWFVMNLMFGSPVAALMAPLWWTVNGLNCLRWWRVRYSSTVDSR